MAMGGQSKRGDVQAEINVTPLIDVCLVLLIIFMVITPMLQKGRPVQLPQTSAPAKKPDQQTHILVSVEDTGKIFVGENWIPEKDFMLKMQETKERDPNKEIILKGDRKLMYGDVLKVMKYCWDAKFSGAGLITEKIQKEGA